MHQSTVKFQPSCKGCRATALKPGPAGRFYKESLKWHPDKNEGPEAKKKFQAISEAYAVLSDPKARAAR